MAERRLLLLVLILIAMSVDISAAWRRIDAGTFAGLRAVHFLDENNGWVGGGNGTLLSTVDGGSRWTRHSAPGGSTVRDIWFSDRKNGWVLCERDRFSADGRGNPAYLLRTKDGGATWVTVELEKSGERFVRMFASQGSQLFLVGEGGIMASFSEPGYVEQRTNLPTRYLVLGGFALEQDRLVLVGGGGEILLVTDRGGEWAVVGFAGRKAHSRLNAVHFTGIDHGWAAGNEGQFFETKNGGKLWKIRDLKTVVDLFDVRFIDPNMGFVVGDGGSIFATSDGGENWKSEASGTKHRLERLSIAGSKAFAVGFGGTVLVRDLYETKR